MASIAWIRWRAGISFKNRPVALRSGVDAMGLILRWMDFLP
jgi:hypothetical protein